MTDMREALKQIRVVCDDNAAAACNQSMALAFVRSVADAALSAPQGGEVVKAQLSDNELYYLRSIKRQLDLVHESLSDEASFSLAGTTFADTRDWLDCFIDEHERKNAAASPPPAIGEEELAQAIFQADYPTDKWERFKSGDVVHVRYHILAKAALALINKNELILNC